MPTTPPTSGRHNPDSPAHAGVGGRSTRRTGSAKTIGDYAHESTPKQRAT